MDLQSIIISYPHWSLERKSSLGVCGPSCHALRWPQSRCSCCLPCLRQFVRVHIEGLVKGHSWLLSVGEAHSVQLCDLANIVISRWCRCWIKTGTTEHYQIDLAAVQCLLQPTNDLMSPVGGAMMCSKAWVWPEAGMPGQVAREQCLGGWHRWGGGRENAATCFQVTCWMGIRLWMIWFVCQNSVQNLDFLRLHEDVTLCQCHFHFVHFFCFL